MQLPEYFPRDPYPLKKIKAYATTELHRAAFDGCYEEVISLITSGVDVDEFGEDRWTALLFAGRQVMHG